MANWSKMFEGLAETTGDYFDALSKENKSKRDAKIASTKLDEAREYSKGLREEARIYNEGKTTETREYNKGLLETARIRQEEDRKEQRTYAAKLLEDKNKRADEKESARQESSKNKAEIAQRKQKLLIQGKAVALAEDIRKGIEDAEDQTSAIDLLNQYETELKLPLSRLGTETVAGEEHWYGNEDDTEKTVLIQGGGTTPDLSGGGSAYDEIRRRMASREGKVNNAIPMPQVGGNAVDNAIPMPQVGGQGKLGGLLGATETARTNIYSGTDKIAPIGGESSVLDVFGGENIGNTLDTIKRAGGVVAGGLGDVFIQPWKDLATAGNTRQDAINFERNLQKALAQASDPVAYLNELMAENLTESQLVVVQGLLKKLQ